MVRTTRPTVRQLLLKAGGAARHREFVGTPESFADEIERWIAADAVDGFTLMPPSYGRDLPFLVEHVAPVLRRRGLLPAADAPRDLHERFGVA